jgi:hypothetical protein
MTLAPKTVQRLTKKQLYLELHRKGVYAGRIRSLVRSGSGSKQALSVVKVNVSKLAKAEALLNKASIVLRDFDLEAVPGGKTDPRALREVPGGKIWVLQRRELECLAELITAEEYRTARLRVDFEKLLEKAPGTLAWEAKIQEKDVAAYCIWRTLKDHNVRPLIFKGALLWHFLGYEPEYPVREVRNLSPQINRFCTAKDTVKRKLEGLEM